jgi:hypothetical protein
LLTARTAQQPGKSALRPAVMAGRHRGAQYDMADAVALFSRVNEQDFAAAQWCQPNMSSRAYARGGVLVPSEAPVISRYYQRYLGLMEEACRSTTG